MKRPQFRLGTLALVVAIAALATALVVQWKREAALRSEIQQARAEMQLSRAMAARAEALAARAAAQKGAR